MLKIKSKDDGVQFLKEEKPKTKAKMKIGTKTKKKGKKKKNFATDESEHQVCICFMTTIPKCFKICKINAY